MIVSPDRFKQIVSEPTTAALAWSGYSAIGRGAVFVSYHDFLGTLTDAVLLEFLVKALAPHLSIQYLLLEEIRHQTRRLTLCESHLRFLGDLSASIRAYNPLTQVVVAAVSPQQSYLATWDAKPDFSPPSAARQQMEKLRTADLKVFFPVVS